jgi:isoamylase
VFLTCSFLERKENNNSYCQDNEISWINWELLDRNSGIFEFKKKMIEFRKNYAILRSYSFFTGEKTDKNSTADISWYMKDLNEPEWDSEESFIAALINGHYARDLSYTDDQDMYMIFNTLQDELIFKIPPAPSGRQWRISINTDNNTGSDIFLYNKFP